MFQTHPTTSSYPSNYYQQLSPPNFCDPNWLGWPLWITTDVIVSVEERQFHAHRSVLCANSGYFRSELSPTDVGDKSKPTIITPGWGTYIGAKTFAILLDFMYSSRLTLDSVNVLEILSAAQILLIPSAIELCRGFLLQRHLTGCLSDFYSINRNLPPPPHFSLNLNSTENSSSAGPAFFPTCSSSTVDRSSNNYFNLRQTTLSGSSHPIIRPIPSKIPFTVIPTVAATTIVCQIPTSTTNTSSTVTSSSTINENEIESNSVSPSTSKTEKSSFISSDISTKQDKINKTGKQESDNTNLSNDSAVKEYVDIACCDGPVKFQRVLNTNCSLVIMMMPEEGDANLLKNEKQSEDKKTNDDSKSEHSETGNDKKESSSVSVLKSTTKSNRRLHYRCVYCRHTYKSLCCYLKHKQRHLNPKSKLGFKVGESGGNGEEKRKSEAEGEEEDKNHKNSDSGNSQEINVPFYPCRVCGLKFPSYYFVHKHRRTCHKMTRTDDSEQ